MIAALHILGALVALVVVSTGLYLFGAWIDQKNGARTMQEASIDLARPLSEISSPAYEPELIRYFGAKYSDDLLKNRLSDFFGVILVAFNWLASLVQIVALGSIAWFTATDDPANAPYAWLVLILPFVAFAIAICAMYICKLFTGRFPGQAKHARKLLSQSISRATQPVA